MKPSGFWTQVAKKRQEFREIADRERVLSKVEVATNESGGCWMYSPDELKTLYGFLKSTAEGNLKKMLVGGRMTEAHLRLVLKIVRAVGEDEFVLCFDAGSFPKLRYNPAESAIKETFWSVCAEACSRVGLLTPQKPAAKAA